VIQMIDKKGLHWPQYTWHAQDLKTHQYLLFKVTGKKGTYRSPEDGIKELCLTIEEANELKRTTVNEGGFARHYKGSDPRSRHYQGMNKGDSND
jgi:hypothetical protein